MSDDHRPGSIATDSAAHRSPRGGRYQCAAPREDGVAMFCGGAVGGIASGGGPRNLRPDDDFFCFPKIIKIIGYVLEQI